MREILWTLVARAAGSSKFPKKVRKKKSSFSYIILYTPSTDHIQYYNMSYSEGDDSEGNCENFSVGNDEGESIDSSTDGDTKSDGDESAASESGASLSDSP